MSKANAASWRMHWGYFKPMMEKSVTLDECQQKERKT
jgi:hypothetical protein